MEVKLKRFHTNAAKPVRKHSNDIGFDCVATERKIKRALGILPVRIDYKLGFGYEIDDWNGFIAAPRSSIRNRYITLSNSLGILDPDFRGEVEASFTPSLLSMLPWFRKQDGKWKFSWNRYYEVGERIIQIIPFQTAGKLEFEWAQTSETKRGTGGHGSTGQKG